MEGDQVRSSLLAALSCDPTVLASLSTRAQSLELEQEEEEEDEEESWENPRTWVWKEKKSIIYNFFQQVTLILC